MDIIKQIKQELGMEDISTIKIVHDGKTFEFIPAIFGDFLWATDRAMTLAKNVDSKLLKMASDYFLSQQLLLSITLVKFDGKVIYENMELPEVLREEYNLCPNKLIPPPAVRYYTAERVYNEIFSCMPADTFESFDDVFGKVMAAIKDTPKGEESGNPTVDGKATPP